MLLATEQSEGFGAARKRFVQRGKKYEANWIDDSGGAGNWSGLRGARNGGRTGSESGDDDGERAIDAVREEHGGCSRFDAGGEIWLQADAGDELVRARGDAHRAVEQFSVLENFRAGRSGGENGGHGSQGKAGGGIETV